MQTKESKKEGENGEGVAMNQLIKADNDSYLALGKSSRQHNELTLRRGADPRQ